MKEYYEDGRLSQSFLKRFLNPNPRSLQRLRAEQEYYYVKEKIYFSKGKLLDLILADEEIDDYFYIESDEYNHPSEVVESIAQQVKDELEEGDVDFSRIYEIKELHNYQARWKQETTDKWITNALLPIVAHKQEIGDRTVLTQEEFVITATMANSILEGPFTKPILDELPGDFQVALYTDIKKILVDYLQIDHEKKVFRIIDFKSTGDFLEKFKKSIKRFRYDIQLSWYSSVVAELYPDYTMLEPVLLVVSSKEPEYAEPFTLSFNILKNARTGWIDQFGHHYKGYDELMSLQAAYQQELYNKELTADGTNYINEL